MISLTALTFIKTLVNLTWNRTCMCTYSRSHSHTQPHNARLSAAPTQYVRGDLQPTLSTLARARLDSSLPLTTVRIAPSIGARYSTAGARIHARSWQSARSSVYAKKDSPYSPMAARAHLSITVITTMVAVLMNVRIPGLGSVSAYAQMAIDCCPMARRARTHKR